MPILLDRTITRDLSEAGRREWIETTGLGGWASSTVSGAHTRRYHGLLVAATRPPAGRTVLLSKLDETIICDGHRYELACNYYPNAVHPEGFRYLETFVKDLFPHFEYQAGAVRMKKTIAAVNDENTTLVLYEVLSAPSVFSLELQPFVAARDYHALMHANDEIQREVNFYGGLLRVQPYGSETELFISIPRADFTLSPDWYFNFEYPRERERGFDFREDLFTYGTFNVTLEKGQKIALLISTRDPAGRDGFALYEQERQRRENLLHFLPKREDFPVLLTLAADQFLVRRAEHLCTIIAGYHWFTDWGRDTMIALPGITLVTGRYDDARKILKVFAAAVSQGMLPNRFPDAGETPEYNTVDATLWFFIASYQYFQYTGDTAFIGEELLPVMQEILAWHEKGTRYHIHVDADGLLYAGEQGSQLTWMDAKIGDVVVTPRQGKAVEINALWYNALRIFADFLKECGNPDEANRIEIQAARVKKRFTEVFWNQQGRCLFDYVDGEYQDEAIRPNQVLALSLPFSLLSKQQSRMVLAVIEEKLLTPFGLRSLDPGHPDYRPRYEGDSWSRDCAYHQGTVWSWLLGPFIQALISVKGTAGRKQAQGMIKQLAIHLRDAGIGTISEIFDGDTPHAPRGCISQAWSVAELLRVYQEKIYLPDFTAAPEPESPPASHNP